MDTPDTLTVTYHRIFLPSQNVTEFAFPDSSIPPVEDAVLWGMRRGEKAVFQRVTEVKYRHDSRFPPYYGYYAHDDTPPTVEEIAVYTWNGKAWK